MSNQQNDHYYETILDHTCQACGEEPKLCNCKPCKACELTWDKDDLEQGICPDCLDCVCKECLEPLNNGDSVKDTGLCPGCYMQTLPEKDWYYD